MFTVPYIDRHLLIRCMSVQEVRSYGHILNTTVPAAAVCSTYGRVFTNWTEILQVSVYLRLVLTDWILLKLFAFHTTLVVPCVVPVRMVQFSTVVCEAGSCLHCQCDYKLPHIIMILIKRSCIVLAFGWRDE